MEISDSFDDIKKIIDTLKLSKIVSISFLILATSFSFFFIFFQSNKLSSGLINFNIMALFLFLKQDIFILPILLLGILFVPSLTKVDGNTNFQRPIYFWICLLIIFGFCWLGHYLVFLNYDLSRDEQMANFDADIFVHFRMFASIPMSWRQMAGALNQTYILPIGNHEDWVSFYLPINALFRAIIGSVFSRTIASPLLVVIGALALWRVTGQLLSSSKICQWTAFALYAGSSQVILTGMTAYAMTGHLALNLLWLTLFLNRKSSSDIAAIFVGFLATGYHQPVFHPLFVLPFLNIVRQEKDWQRLSVYAFAYMAIGLFWIFWPSWVNSFGNEPVPLSANPNGIGLLSRLSNMVTFPNERSIWLMSVNLLRFVAWQHLMLLPLGLFGTFTCWKVEPMVRALAIGIGLTILVMFILMPYQGHGWGYRYLHGLIGSACLLSAYGVRSLEVNGYSLMRPLNIGTIVSVLILLPLHGIFARQMVFPFETASEAISNSNADAIIVDDTHVLFGQDLVINLPDLSNKPIRLMASQITVQDINELCANEKISFFDVRKTDGIAKLFGSPVYNGPSKVQTAFEAETLKRSCQ